MLAVILFPAIQTELRLLVVIAIADGEVGLGPGDDARDAHGQRGQNGVHRPELAMPVPNVERRAIRESAGYVAEDRRQPFLVLFLSQVVAIDLVPLARLFGSRLVGIGSIAAVIIHVVRRISEEQIDLSVAQQLFPCFGFG